MCTWNYTNFNNACLSACCKLRPTLALSLCVRVSFHVLIVKHLLSYQAPLRPPHLLPGKSSRYFPSGRLGWSVRDYWRSGRKKSVRSMTRYWRQNLPVRIYAYEIFTCYRYLKVHNPCRVILKVFFFFRSQNSMMPLSNLHMTSWCEGLESSLLVVSIIPI